MANEMEKALLDCFENGQLYEGIWRGTSAVLQMMRELGYNGREVRPLISELHADGCLVERKPIFYELRLTPIGWGRRFEVGYYMDSIGFEFREKDPKLPYGSDWWMVTVNGVMWGKFVARYADDIEANLGNITHSLCLTQRSNKEILEAIRTRFAKPVAAAATL